MGWKFKKVSMVIIFVFLLSFPFIGITIIYKFIEFKSNFSQFSNKRATLKFLMDTDRIVFQRRNNDCGVASLKMIFDYFDIPVSIEELYEKALHDYGSSIFDLKKMAESKGLEAIALLLTFNDLKKVSLPVIALINENHFVVIAEIANNKIIILDPAIGKLRYSYKQFIKVWKGETLIIQKINKYRERG